jgi:hypothetical protein
MADAPAASIHHHFEESLLRPAFDDPEYRNDFAFWVRRNLRDVVLAERLTAIDPMGFPDIEELRKALLEVIEERLAEVTYIPWAPAGEEFHFLRSQVVVFDTGQRAETPADLAERIPTLPVGSIFFHFVEARRRPPIALDDFSAWLVEWGPAYSRVRERLGAIDYTLWSLPQIRARIAGAFGGFAQEGPR